MPERNENENKTQDSSEKQALERAGERKGEPGSPFAFMRRFGEEMDRLFEDFGFGRGWLRPVFGGRELAALWSPQIEIFERQGQLVVRADLPGLTKDDVKVELTDNAVTIEGERRREREEKQEGYYRSECSYGRFYRQLPLPEGANPDTANATFRNGVLEITMQAPKRVEQKARRLEIGEVPGEPKSASKAAGNP